jgi:uncharacterized protein
VASKKALLVRCGHPGHFPIETGDVFVPFLEANYDVTYEDSTKIYAARDQMADFDVIVQSNSANTITPEELSGLRYAVRSGTGLAGWHGGICDTYRASSDYLHLIGGTFACHKADRPDEERQFVQDEYFVEHSYEIVPEKADHPIVAGIPTFSLKTEQYWMLTDNAIDVLATTTVIVRDFDPWHQPIISPAVWTREWGQGQVFVATPGHDAAAVSDPNVRTIVERGISYVTR